MLAATGAGGGAPGTGSCETRWRSKVRSFASKRRLDVMNLFGRA